MNDEPKRFLITGATGLLGSHLVEQLREAGKPVRAMVRPGSDSRFLRELGAEVVEGDLHDPASVHKAAEKVQTVIHAAAKVSDWGPWKEFEKEAVTSTRNVTEACRAQGVDRLLHVSSVSVYGHPKVGPTEGITESAPVGQGFWMWDYYPRAKLIAENLAREFPRTIVVRPSWIYGPRDRVTIPRVIPALLERRVPILGDGKNYLNIIYAGDVARGIVLAAENPNSVGETYNLCSVGEVTQLDMVNALTDALGLPRVTRHVPYFLALRFAWVQEAMAKLLGRAKPPRITRRAIYLIGRPTQYRIDKAVQQLGWKPEVGIQEGVQRTLAWFTSLPEYRHLQINVPILPNVSRATG